MGYFEFQDILVCPACREPFEKKGEFDCLKCKLSFDRSVDGRPVLLDKESTHTVRTISQTEQANIDSRSVLESVRAFSWLAGIVKVLRPPSFSLNTSFPLIGKILSEKSLSLDPRILFVGGIRKSDRKYFGFSKRLVVDIQDADLVDIVADANKLPIASASFDIVVSQALLEHVCNYRRVLGELSRVLKPGGLVYVSIPFMQPYHSSPSDFRRFTVKGIEEEMGEYIKLSSGVASGPGSAMARFLPTFFMSFTDDRILKRMLFYVCGWLFFWLKYLDLFLYNKKGAHIMCAAVYFVGQKPHKNEVSGV